MTIETTIVVVAFIIFVLFPAVIYAGEAINSKNPNYIKLAAKIIKEERAADRKKQANEDHFDDMSGGI